LHQVGTSSLLINGQFQYYVQLDTARLMKERRKGPV